MNNKRSFSSYLLIALVFFQIISAIPAGLSLIFDPSGGSLGHSKEILQHSPFSDFLFPGLFLFVLLGLIPVLIFYGLIKKIQIS